MISKIKKNNCFMKISKNVFGRIHMTQFELNPQTKKSKFHDLKVGDKLTAKVLQVKKSKVTQIELTCLDCHLSLSEGEIAEKQ